MNLHLSQLSSGIRRWLPLLCATIALLGVRSAHADFIVSVSDVTVTPGSSNDSLEVDLTNTGVATTIAGFSFGISTNTSNIDFTSATTGTTQPYIFASDSVFGPTISTQTGQSLTASDLSANNGDNVGANTTVGLGEVFFNVAPGTSLGPITVTLTPSATSLSDPSGNNITINTLENGSINVVPEPSTLLLAVLASPAALWMCWRRRRCATV